MSFGAQARTYSGTTTTYGTQTTYIPYSIDRYQQAAIFFAPLNRRGLGVMFNQLTTAQRQQFGTNKALIVVAVRTGSPAFMADILPGDLILSIGGHDVYDAASLPQDAAATVGQKVAVVLLRNGSRTSKMLFVPAGGW